MKNLIFIIIAIIVGVVFFQSNDQSSGSGTLTALFIPDAAAGQRTGSGIKKYEFTELFDQDKPFSKLAKEDYYTVIES